VERFTGSPEGALRVLGTVLPILRQMMSRLRRAPSSRNRRTAIAAPCTSPTRRATSPAPGTSSDSSSSRIPARSWPSSGSRSSRPSASVARRGSTGRSSGRFCDRYGILLIVDEVISGFRTHGHVVRQPAFRNPAGPDDDAKGISSGYVPMGSLGEPRKPSSSPSSTSPTCRPT